MTLQRACPGGDTTKQYVLESDTTQQFVLESNTTKQRVLESDTTKQHVLENDTTQQSALLLMLGLQNVSFISLISLHRTGG